MGRPIELPVTVATPQPGREDSTTTTHPAYAQIVARRVNGHACLYGSDFEHNGYVTVAISRSKLMRDLSSDWHYGHDEIIEVALSEAQWATFVSSMNIGSGVPCTLSYEQGTMVPGLPQPVSRADQFSGEMSETVKSSIDRLRLLSTSVADMGLPKRKAEQIRSDIAMAIQELEANVPFVAERFNEHVEEGIEAAKVEIHGYMVGAMTRAGLGALAQTQGPLVLDAK
jgi:hypothetical protein